jgi:nucleotide-binding universal stress UspA family protein
VKLRLSPLVGGNVDVRPKRHKCLQNWELYSCSIAMRASGHVSEHETRNRTAVDLTRVQSVRGATMSAAGIIRKRRVSNRAGQATAQSSKNNAADKKMLLAIDCFSDDVKKLKAAVLTAKCFAQQLGWKTQASTLVSPVELDWPTEFSDEWDDEVKKLGKSRLQKALSLLGLGNENNATVIFDSNRSRSSSVEAMIEEASAEHAAVLAIVTHVRKKPAFAFPGGFAERMLGASPVPILAINALSRAAKKFKTVLVPMDLREESFPSFLCAVKIAKALRARLVLFYHAPSPANPELISGASMAGGLANVTDFLREAEEWNRGIANKWVADAIASGVKAELLFSHMLGRTGNAIVKYARETKSDLVIMPTRAGAKAGFFFSGTAREVLIKATCPVLFVRDSFAQNEAHVTEREWVPVRSRTVGEMKSDRPS